MFIKNGIVGGSLKVLGDLTASNQKLKKLTIESDNFSHIVLKRTASGYIPGIYFVSGGEYLGALSINSAGTSVVRYTVDSSTGASGVAYKLFDESDIIPLANGGTGANLSSMPANAILRKAGDGSNNVYYQSTANGAFYATSANGYPTFGTLPIAQGGTGATTAAGILTNAGLTATAAELNKLDGVTTTTAQFNYLNTLTSNVQTQLNAKLNSSQLASGHSVKGKIANIGGDGVMEVGQYIDFHVNDTTTDYSVRITASTSGLTLGGTTSGTFKGNMVAPVEISGSDLGLLTLNRTSGSPGLKFERAGVPRGILAAWANYLRYYKPIANDDGTYSYTDDESYMIPNTRVMTLSNYEALETKNSSVLYFCY